MIALLFAAWSIGAASVLQLEGTVRDPSGASIANARVLVRAASGAEHRTVTQPDGRFAFDSTPSGELMLIVRAEGFAEHRQSIAPGSARVDLAIVLSPATLAETVTVTAARAEQRSADVAASVTVIPREAIQRSPALVADDVLRQVPTFSLFRRASSLASHPTAQGVSLRGIGPSGVSRTLVLFDGVPFNDPFGGWVYWTRVPLSSVERIEVVDGATSSVYGNYAMGGVINIVTAAPAKRTVEIRSQYGSHDTPTLNLSASDTWGRLRASADAGLFSTDGYPVVASGERGAVDTNATVSVGNATLKLQYDVSDRAQAFVRAWHFRESRDNGKASTIDGTPEANDTTWNSVSGGVRVRLPGDSDLQVSLFADAVQFKSNFLAVPPATPPRSFGRMSLEQTVPSDGLGGSAQWTRAAGTQHLLSVGADWRSVDGESQEEVLDSERGSEVIVRRVTGGAQRSAGLFVQDLFTPSPDLILTVAARLDHWRNVDGHHLEFTAPENVPTANHRPTLPERRDTVVSPRVSVLYHATDHIAVWGAIGTGFRAPTLNELYRQFRVGAVTTRANDQLGPERLLGGEGGIRIAPARHVSWRTTWFDNQVRDAVSNVTVVPGAVQQRQNIGRTRIRGVQTDVEYAVRPSFRVSGAYVYSHATVRAFEANPSLVGKSLPQAPRHRATLLAVYSNPSLVNFSAAVQVIGRQFDDDQNVRTVPGHTEPGLPGYAVVDLSASRRLSRNLELFAGVQNLFDRDYFVGTLPTTIGAGRMLHAGLVVRFAPR